MRHFMMSEGKERFDFDSFSSVIEQVLDEERPVLHGLQMAIKSKVMTPEEASENFEAYRGTLRGTVETDSSPDNA